MFDVSLVSCENYEPERVAHALAEAIDAVGGLDWVRPGMTVAVKANLAAPMKPETAATTHPVVLAELAKLLAERGARAVVGDSPGGPFSALYLNRVYAAAGLHAVEAAGGELNRDFGRSAAQNPDAVKLKDFEYTTWLSEADAIISFCKLKSHGLMGMTAAVKNMFGAIPGVTKPEYHYRFPDMSDFADMLVDINEYFKPRLCLCDAVDCMEGNGPTQGTVRHMGALLASRSPYPMDLVCAKLVGETPERVPTVAAAIARRLGPPSLSAVSVSGDVEALAIPDFRHVAEMRGFNVERPDDGVGKRLLHGFLKTALAPKPVLREGCVGCGVCAGLCPAKAITIENKRARIDRKKCIRCFCCQEFCPEGAMRVGRKLARRL